MEKDSLSVNAIVDNSEIADTVTDMMWDVVANTAKLVPPKDITNYDKNIEDKTNLSQYFNKEPPPLDDIINVQSEHRALSPQPKSNDIPATLQPNIASINDTPLPNVPPKDNDIQHAMPINEIYEEKKKKLDIIRQLGVLESRGIKLSQRYNINSDYETMKYEYDLHKKIRSKKLGIKFMNRCMVNSCLGMEYALSFYNPFNIKLDDWNEKIDSEIDDYYEVFSELYEKHMKDDSVFISPEFKLAYMLLGSALTHHFKNELMGAIPDVDTAMKNMPSMANQLKGHTNAKKVKEVASTYKRTISNKNDKEHDNARKLTQDMYNMKLQEIRELRQRDQQNKSHIESLEKHIESHNNVTTTKQKIMRAPPLIPQNILPHHNIPNRPHRNIPGGTQTSSFGQINQSTSSFGKISNKHRDDDRSADASRDGGNRLSFPNFMPNKKIKRNKKTTVTVDTSSIMGKSFN